jgi:uncharacterized protein with HEPN domain
MSSEKHARALAALEYHLNLIEEFTAGMDFQVFAADIKTLYAVIRCLEIISEASRRLSAPFKMRHQDLPWKQIAGAGNVYRHEYEDVEAQIISRTIRVDVPHLRRRRRAWMINPGWPPSPAMLNAL